MPLIKIIKGRVIRSTKRIGNEIRVTFEGSKGQPGEQKTYTPREYEQLVQKVVATPSNAN